MLLESIVVRASPIHGRGLFATTRLPKGTAVWHPCHRCKTLTAQQARELPSSVEAWFDEFGYRLADQGLLLPCPTAYLMNHSCDANVLDFGLDFGIAVRDIAVDEEVMCDFRTFSDDPPWSMVCRCRSSECSGSIEPWQGGDASLHERWRARVVDALEHLPRVAQPLAASLSAASGAFSALSKRTWRPELLALYTVRRPGFLVGPPVGRDGSA